MDSDNARIDFLIALQTEQHSHNDDNIMQLDYLKSMPRIVAECVKLHLRASAGAFRRDDAKQMETLQKVVESIWNLLAASTLCTLPQEANAAIDDLRPGYVVFSVGQLRVFVPFFLANVFPYGESLRALCALGAQLQIGTDSVICVSGSSCQLHLGLPVGDLDFCEYVPKGDPNLSYRLLNKLIGVAEQPFCYKFTMGNTNRWTRPWPVDLTTNAGPVGNVGLRAALAATDVKQCTFVVELPTFGVIDATNLIVPLDYENTESAEAKRSFAAQEAPFTDESWTPRDLSSPLALGEYILWLLDTAGRLCIDAASLPRSAVKAVRRALSAARLLFLRSDADCLISLLRDDGARLAALYDRCMLYVAISKIDDPTVQQFMPKLRESIDQIRGVITKDAAYYAQLTEQETKSLLMFRDRVVPEVNEILRRMNRLLAIDLVTRGNTR